MRNLAPIGRGGLADRSESCRLTLDRQRGAILVARDELRQTTLFEVGDKAQKRQVELDIGHLDRRVTQIDADLEHEPRAIEGLYDVQMTRLVPIGLVVAWPESMT